MIIRSLTACAQGLVAKLRRSTYAPGKRPDYWCKHVPIQATEVIVCAWRPGQNRLSGSLGGLLLGGHDPETGELVYIGDVGTGFSEADRARLLVQLEKLEQRKHPFAMTPPREDVARAHWVTPELVGEVVFRQFTRGEGRLRHTAWRGLRDDRTPAEVRAPRARERVAAETAPAPAKRRTAAGKPSPQPDATALGTKVTVQAGNRRVTLSNLDKQLYPDGFTKGEVIIHRIAIEARYLSLAATPRMPFLRELHSQDARQSNQTRTCDQQQESELVDYDKVPRSPPLSVRGKSALIMSLCRQSNSVGFLVSYQSILIRKSYSRASRDTSLTTNASTSPCAKDNGGSSGPYVRARMSYSSCSAFNSTRCWCTVTGAAIASGLLRGLGLWLSTHNRTD